jgi:hypothetical protein
MGMVSDWVSFLAYPNLFGIKGFVVVVDDDGYGVYANMECIK